MCISYSEMTDLNDKDRLRRRAWDERRCAEFDNHITTSGDRPGREQGRGDRQFGLVSVFGGINIEGEEEGQKFKSRCRRPGDQDEIDCEFKILTLNSVLGGKT